MNEALSALADDSTQPILTESPTINRQRFWLAIISALIIGGALLVWGLYDANLHPIPVAPSFTFTAYDGTILRSADLRGKVVVINFWASWCRPCAAEAPTLAAIWQDYQNRPDQAVVFMGVAQGDTSESAQAFIREYGLKYANGPDNGIVSTFGVQGLPTTFIIDRQGYIRDTLFSVIDPDDLRNRIDTALNR